MAMSSPEQLLHRNCAGKLEQKNARVGVGWAMAPARVVVSVCEFKITVEK